jgi:hypothetical protein
MQQGREADAQHVPMLQGVEESMVTAEAYWREIPALGVGLRTPVE